MKIDAITTTNQKGQIVIPKKLRDAFAIKPDTPLYLTVKDEGIHIQPFSKPLTQIEKNKAMLEILRNTRGAWADHDWDEWDKMQKKKRKIELAASKRRKEAW